MITFTVKETTFEVEQYSLPDGTYHIIIQKGSHSIDEINELLSGIYDVALKDEEEGLEYGFNTEDYDVSISDQGDTVILDYFNNPVTLNTLNSKLDYLAIMSDVDLNEVAL